MLAPAVLAAAQPSPLWFATRGAGTAVLVLLTSTLALGIATSMGGRSDRWPRFLSASLHRNISLVALALLVVHIVTAIADPFAKMGWRDAVVPFVSAYRPVWTGLGVLAAELFVALIITSAVRPWMGYAGWRAIHWVAYTSWPLAILHGLGDGTDARVPWSMGLTVGCVTIIVMVVALRLGTAQNIDPRARTSAAAVLALTVALGSAWAAAGPLKPGWSWRAGTPTAILKPLVGSAAPKVGQPGPSPIVVQPAASTANGQTEDPLQGTIVAQPGGGNKLVLTDLHDPTLQLVIRTARPGEPATALAMVRSGQVTCVTTATVGDAIAADCGKTHLVVVLQRAGDVVTGRLVRTGG
jgi:methionine sulfoxide reductase heme-binding subunit